jgi:prepilin-type N-terminal cleavage/methylation domain-containing protein
MSKNLPVRKFQSKSRFGFTLVELLVVVVSMTILFSLGYANYRDFARRQILAGAVRTTKADIRLTQEFAFASRKPSSCGDTDTMIGYIFQRVSASSYEIVASCSSGLFPSRRVDLSDKYGGVVIQPFSQILFKVLGQGTDITSGGSVDIVLELPTAGAGYTQTITVTSAGEIE